MLKSPSNLGPLAPSPSSHRIIRRASRGRAVAATALTTTTPVTAVPRRGGLGAGRMGRGPRGAPWGTQRHGAQHGEFLRDKSVKFHAGNLGKNHEFFCQLGGWKCCPVCSCISPKQHDKYMIWYGCGSKLWYPVEYQIADRWTFRSLFPQIPKFGIGGFDSSPYIYICSTSFLTGDDLSLSHQRQNDTPTSRWRPNFPAITKKLWCTKHIGHSSGPSDLPSDYLT